MRWAYLLSLAGLAAACTESTNASRGESAEDASDDAGPSDAGPDDAGSKEGGSIDAGADAGGISLPFMESGKRLHARRFVAHGAEQFQTFYDTKLGTACVFDTSATWKDLRCVPSTKVNVVYLDATCTEPASATRGAAVDRGGWVSENDSSRLCDAAQLPEVRVFTVGQHISDGGHIFDEITSPAMYAWSDGECVRTNGGCGKIDCALDRLRVASPDALVAAHLTSVDVGGGLFANRLVADDGAGLTLGAKDAAGEACSFAPDGQCLPGRIPAAGNHTFSDATCQTTAYESSPQFASALDPTACADSRFGVELRGDTVRVHELRQLSPGYYDLDDHGIATPGTPCRALPGGYPVYALGDEVTTPFPTARKVRIGEGALHMDYFAARTSAGDETGLLAASGGLTDEQGRRCAIVPDATGTWRCFPEGVLVQEVQLWKDPECSKRLYVHPAAGTDLSALRLVPGNDYGVSELSAMFAVERYDGPVYEWVAACEPFTGLPPVTLLTKGEAVPFSTLAALTLE